MTSLLQIGHADHHGEYKYENVQRWGNRCHGGDMFALDKIFFPININASHWVLVIVHMQEQRIQFYDSMGSGGEEYLEHVFRYIQDEHLCQKARLLPNPSSWCLVPCTQDTPQQGSGYDCGVFCCTFMDFIALDPP